MNLTPGTHKIRVEIALGPNPPIRYCAAYGEFEHPFYYFHILLLIVVCFVDFTYLYSH